VRTYSSNLNLSRKFFWKRDSARQIDRWIDEVRAKKAAKAAFLYL